MGETIQLSIEGVFKDHSGKYKGQKLVFVGHIEVDVTTNKFRGRLKDRLGESSIEGGFFGEAHCDFRQVYDEEGEAVTYWFAVKNLKDGTISKIINVAMLGGWLTETRIGRAVCRFKEIGSM